MANGSTRLRWIRDQLDRSAEELAATIERLPADWRAQVGPDLERLVSDARELTRSVGTALEVRERTRSKQLSRGVASTVSSRA